MSYAIILIFGMTFSYFILAFSLQIFVNGKIKKCKFSLLHILCFLAFAILSLKLVSLIPNARWENRLLHAITGAFTMCVVFFCSFLASTVRLKKIQFFLLCFLCVSFFGILNELGESYLQFQKGMIFSADAYDTWFDLRSNTLGTIVGAGFFTFFVNLQDGKNEI